jgi:hypothetical protein
VQSVTYKALKLESVIKAALKRQKQKLLQKISFLPGIPQLDELHFTNSIKIRLKTHA